MSELSKQTEVTYHLSLDKREARALKILLSGTYRWIMDELCDAERQGDQAKAQKYLDAERDLFGITGLLSKVRSL